MIRTVQNVPDQLNMWPEFYERYVLRRSPQASLQAAQRAALFRPYPARLTGREIQALRAAGLSLRKRPGTRSQILSVSQRYRPTAANGLCAECQPSSSEGVPCQLSQGARSAGRDLRDQYRAAPPTRGTGLNGPGRRCSRFHKGRRHHRQHGRLLSCCQRCACIAAFCRSAFHPQGGRA